MNLLLEQSSFNWFAFVSAVVGGLGIFLFGMRMLSESLQAVAGELIRKVLGWLTNNKFMAMTVGLVVTMIVQSSSVTTVMVVGFVNAGLMTLKQAIGVILGANIGTTITGWIFAVKVGKYGISLIAAGLVPYFFMKKTTPKNVGKILIALGFIFMGLVTMSTGFAPLKDLPEFEASLQYFQANNIFSVLACVLVGCLLTFLVQSSSAMLAITMGLAGVGAIEFPTACALVLGENIGTTVTALLASIGGNIHARRAALAHTTVNVLGVTVMVIIFQPYIRFVANLIETSGDAMGDFFAIKDSIKEKANDPRVLMKIAAAHSIFNVANVLLFIWFIPHIERAVTWMAKGKDGATKSRLMLLGDLSQISPELALEETERELALMAEVTRDLFEATGEVIEAKEVSAELIERVDHLENVTDKIQKEITVFLCEVLQMKLEQDQSLRAYALIRISDEFESVADYCQRIALYCEKISRSELSMSESAITDLREAFIESKIFFVQAVEYMQESSDKALNALLKAADSLSERNDSLRSGHLERMKTGACESLVGLTYSDIIVALRRLKNHSINIADAHDNRWEDRRETLRNTYSKS